MLPGASQRQNLSVLKSAHQSSMSVIEAMGRFRGELIPRSGGSNSVDKRKTRNDETKTISSKRLKKKTQFALIACCRAFKLAVQLWKASRTQDGLIPDGIKAYCQKYQCP